MLSKKIGQNKIDGALGAMIIDDQPTHSIYHNNIAKSKQNVNTIYTYGGLIFDTV